MAQNLDRFMEEESRTKEHLTRELEEMRRRASYAENRLSKLQKELFAENQHLLNELTVLHAMATAAVKATDEDALIERATQIIGKAIDSDNFGIRLVDPVSGNLRNHSSYWAVVGSRSVGDTAPGEGITGRVVATGRPWRVPDVTREPAYIGVNSAIRSELCVPVKTGAQVIAVLNVESTRPNAFSEADERLLITLAGQLAAAIERIRLSGTSRRQTEEKAALLATTKAISSLQLDDVLNIIAHEARELLKTDTSRIHLTKHNSQKLYCAVALPKEGEAVLRFSAQVGKGITGHVAVSGAPEIVENTLEDPRAIQIPGTPVETESMALAPLKIRQQVIGVMTVTRKGKAPPFTNADLTLLTAFADQAAVAIDNARLFEAERRHAAQQRALVETIEDILAALDLNELWSAMTNAIHQTLATDRMAIYLYEASTDTLSCPYSFGLSVKYVNELNRQFRDVPGSQVLRDLHPVVVNDTLTDPSTDKLRALMEEEGFRSYAVFPLTAPEGPLGVMVVYHNEPLHFTADDLASGHTLAHIMAVALRNTRLLSEATQALTREQQLNEITRTLGSVHDLPTILANVVHKTTELIDADAGLLGLVIDNQIMTFYPYNMPKNISFRPLPKGKGVAWNIVETGASSLLPRYEEHPAAQYKWASLGIGACLCVPIVAGADCLGALQLFSMKPGARFSRRDLALAESVGRQAGIAIQNARLYAEAQQRAGALKAALTRQEELDNMKNLFIQNVSHELRTPLGIIYGHAELLESAGLGELEPVQQQSANIIARRVRMLTNMVDDLTALLAAETQEFRRELIDPVQLVYSMLADFRLQAEQARIVLTAEIEEDLPMLRGDPTHLRRVFDNLMSNAFKFTPDGGLVTMRMWAQGMDVMIEVSDTGVGISEGQLKHIFDRFYQVDGGATSKHKGKGLGLGLALVKEIVEAHRGRVTVDSKPDEGAAFQIRLPGHERQTWKRK